MTVQTTAVVTVMVEVRSSTNWQDTCPMSQIHKQAKEEALHIIAKLNSPNIKVVGIPKVGVVLVEKE